MCCLGHVDKVFFFWLCEQSHIILMSDQYGYLGGTDHDMSAYV